MAVRRGRSINPRIRRPNKTHTPAPSRPQLPPTVRPPSGYRFNAGRSGGARVGNGFYAMRRRGQRRLPPPFGVIDDTDSDSSEETDGNDDDSEGHEGNADQLEDLWNQIDPVFQVMLIINLFPEINDIPDAGPHGGAAPAAAVQAVEEC